MTKKVAVIDYICDMPIKDINNLDKLKKHVSKENFFDRRISELRELFDTNQEYPTPPQGVYFDSLDFLNVDLNKQSKQLLTNSEKLTLSIIDRIKSRNKIGTSPVYICNATASVDTLDKAILAKSAFKRQNQVDVSLLNSVGYLGLANIDKKFIEQVNAASSSGISGIIKAAEYILNGDFNLALVTGANCVTLPTPFEVYDFGVGNDRFVQPFQNDSKGHYISEGGMGILLKNYDEAIKDEDTIICTIEDFVANSMGNRVLNRHLIEKNLDRLLLRNIDSDKDRIYIDFYGRGNLIEDSVEISVLKKLKKKWGNIEGGYLKGFAQYFVGYYGLIGFCELLRNKRQGNSAELKSLIDYDRSKNIKIDDFNKYVFPNYSLSGNFYAIVIDMDGGN
jgi:hypothetical protein